MTNICGIILSYVYIALIIVGAKLFEKAGKVASRKFIHIMLGNWWIIAMFFFDNVIYASFVPATFVIINYISYKKQIISVMERENNEKEGLGTVYYALSLLVLSIISFGILNKPEIGLVPCLVMAYGDGLAAIIGKAVKSKKYEIGNSQKTIAGSLTMFIVTVLAVFIYLTYMQNPAAAFYAIIIGILITIVEAISIKGLDNLTVPICTLLL